MNIFQFPVVRKAAAFLKKFAKEFIIAFVLAIVAAFLFDFYADFQKRKTLENNAKATATLTAIDANGKQLLTASGIFISGDGQLVTNYHVIRDEKMRTIFAKLKTGAMYELKGIVGISKKYDLALLQFDAKEVPYVTVNPHICVEAGETVVTIGSPQGLGDTISEGVVSNPSRKSEGVDYIQFTAPISPGSSGGGLFNQKGYIVGVTTMSLSGTAVENLNFAVPVKYIEAATSGNDVEFTSNSPEFFYSEGVIYSDREEYDKAEASFKNAISLDSEYKNAYTKLGDLYYDTRHYDQEMSILQEAATLFPNDAEIQSSLGGAYEDKGRYDDAIAAYERAISIKPDDKDSLYYLCLLNMIIGKNDTAAGYISPLTKLDAGTGREMLLLLNRVGKQQ